jgi:hypothetical protein
MTMLTSRRGGHDNQRLLFDSFRTRSADPPSCCKRHFVSATATLRLGPALVVQARQAASFKGVESSRIVL